MIRRIVMGILTVVILISLFGYLFLLSIKPQYDGLVASSGIKDSVTVYHDDFGVPHIYASNAEDAYFTLGYLHAQERLFQMEMVKRIASGRLAEIVGKDALTYDKLFRTLGIDQKAKQSVKDYLSFRDLPYQKVTWAYIDGINEFIDHGKTPIEFHIMGIPKEHFTPENVYHTIAFMSFGFADGFREDPLFTQIKNQLGDEYLKDIMPITDPEGSYLPVQQPDNTLITTASHLAIGFTQIFENLPAAMWLGSNGWAISGSRTKSGKPILANDTHMGYSQPSVWFEAHLEYPSYRFYGYHAAGIPFGILGNNDKLGWGFTMFENDDVDFYIEELKDNQYKFKGGWHTLSSQKELIKIKNEENLEIEVRATHHGPIINDVIEEMDSVSTPISAWWAYSHFPTTLLSAMHDINHAQHIEQVEAAAANIHAPGLNLMYADTENIAWWALAKLPKRPAHVNSKLILDGVSGDDDFSGFYPFEKNPHNINPTSGLVYTTNNQPDTVDGVLYLGYYRPKDRALGAKQSLSKDQKWDIEKNQEVQLKSTSPTDPSTAKSIASLLTNTNTNDQWAIKELSNWDGNHALESKVPGIYYTLLSRIFYEAMADEVGYETYKKIANSIAMRGGFKTFIENESSKWWGDINTPEVESRGDIINRAFEKTINTLKSKYGDDYNEWQWSKMHTITHNHPLSKIKPLDKIFGVGPYPISGGLEVLNNQKFKLDTTATFDVIAGPAVRWVLDFSDIENGATIIPAGQSGNVMSKHYNDQALMFVNGVYRKRMMNKGEITSNSKKLIFTPVK